VRGKKKAAREQKKEVDPQVKLNASSRWAKKKKSGGGEKKT
jgi:hypothetical protein